MSLAAFTLNALLAVLLFAALGMGWRLERRLKALRASHEGFAKAVADLDAAALKAERGLADLRAATDEAAESLAERIESARRLALRLDNAMSQATSLEIPEPRAARRDPAPRPAPAPRPSLNPSRMAPPERSRVRVDDDLFDGGASLRAIPGGRA
jgi:hypothetical protein